MHNAAFHELGLDRRYVKLPVPPELFAETVRALPGSGYDGANVTIPYKQAALRLADAASPAAAAIGAANTLSFDAGSISAENTDAPGFLAALGHSPRGQRALVLGAGGSGRAMAWALADAGAAEVLVWNRTPERAARLAAELGVTHVARPRPADLVVNATSVGLGRSGSLEEVLAALELSELDPPETLVDLVYAEEDTALCRWARGVSAQVVDGLEVLVRQGALSFERWTGRSAPLEVMRAAARARLAEEPSGLASTWATGIEVRPGHS